jgi:1,4-alpha-glucan branching enzyme
MQERPEIRGTVCPAFAKALLAPALLALVGLTAAASSACGATSPAGQGADTPEPSTIRPVTAPSGTTDAGRADGATPRPRATGGPGAHLTDKGVLFRVWAPNAASAWVSGDFAPARVPLVSEPGGFFSAEVAGAKAGAKYTFVLAPREGQGELERLDPYCRERTESRVACRVTDPFAFAWKDQTFSRPKREKQIVYEMHIGSFSVDPAKRHGTFASAKARLGELADLGVNVIELMPVFDFGGNPDGWGYNPHLHFATKTSYGTPEELRSFVDEAHQKGIAVWIDAVVNHHDGYPQAPLRCFDGNCPNKTAGIYYFGPGAYANTPWGPRPNFVEPAVKQMLLDATTAWIDEFHGDGFRWDSTSNIRAIDGQGTTPGGKELLVEQNRIAKARGATSTAEDLKGFADLTQAVDKGGFGFDAQWDGFGYDVARVIEGFEDDARDLGAISNAYTGGYNGDPFSRVLFTETHDTVGNGGARLPNRIDPANPESIAARRRSMLAGAILLTAPGIPMFFMGQEGLALGTFTDPPKPLAAKSAAGVLVAAYYKDLVALRKNASGKTGALSEAGVEILHRNDTAKVLVVRRHGPSGEDVIVALNFRNRAYTRYDVGVPAGGAYRVRLTTDRKAYGADFTEASVAPVEALAQAYEGRPFTLPLALGAYGVVVLSR